LTTLVNATSLARDIPAVYVVEDAHWIDPVSESMIADFLTGIPQTPSLVIVTYRPEYRGALAQIQGAHTIALAPLSDQEIAALITELLGPDTSVAPFGQIIAERGSGTPFFAEEIVRELAKRGVLRGELGAYRSTAEVAEVSVPATLQATIAARIDRLDRPAKRTRRRRRRHARHLVAAAAVAAGARSGDETGYRDSRDRYRAMAKSLDFEGHLKWAEAMP
jgi:adenylate cyclase